MGPSITVGCHAASPLPWRGCGLTLGHCRKCVGSLELSAYRRREQTVGEAARACVARTDIVAGEGKFPGSDVGEA